MKEAVRQIVSRETMKKYEQYYDFIAEWSNNSTLVQRKTLNLFWERHIMDSLQLEKHLETDAKILDVGSGAGFPGMVLAMKDVKLSLCESNRTKSFFLQELARKTNTEVLIFNRRVEDLTDDFNTLISRACAPLDDFFSITYKIVSRETFDCCLLLKGKNFQIEVENALKTWNFSWKAYKSVTCHEGKILKLWNIKRR